MNIGKKGPGPPDQFLNGEIQQVRNGSAARNIQCILLHGRVIPDQARDQETGGYTCIYVIIGIGNKSCY
jgi:hypothetical protein